MRIAFVTFEYPPFINGGAGIYAFNITRELARLGHEVVIFSPEIGNINEEDNINNIKIRRIKINKNLPFISLQFWLYLSKEIKKAEIRKKFDIVHFNSLSYWFLKKRLSKDAIHVITIHHLINDAIEINKTSLFSRIKDINTENNIFLLYIEKRCLKCIDHIIAVSHFTKNQIVRTYGISSSKIKVIYNGINLNYNSIDNKELIDVKKRLNIGDKPVILFVGRIDDPRKGLISLLKSFRKLLDKIDAMLIIVGKGSQTGVKNVAKNLKISDNIILTGFVEEKTLKNYYRLCDVYVCPSKLEGFGLTILEAMSFGKPIVAINSGSIPEIICNNGILIDNSENLSDAIIESLKDNKNDVCKNVYCQVKKFTWENAAKELSELYHELKIRCKK